MVVLIVSTDYRLIRWGRVVVPKWAIGSVVSAPPAGSKLVSVTVSDNVMGYIYGFFITANESNVFRLVWTSGGTRYERVIVFGGNGSVQYVDLVPINEGYPADASSEIYISVDNVGTTIYQAGILYA